MHQTLSQWKRLCPAVGLAAVIWCAGAAWGQQPGGQGGRGAGGFGGGFGAGGFGAFGFGGFGGGSLTDLLRRQDVRKELELLDDQVAKLTDLEEKVRERMREAMASFRPPEGDRGQPGGQRGAGDGDDFRAAIEKVNKQTREDVGQILLPHQMARLDQLAVQMRLQGGAASVLNRELMEKLGVTDEQRDQLRTKAEEADQELQKKIAEIRREAQNQLISNLSADQQAKFKELVGEPFTFENEPPRFGPGGGFGGAQGGGRRGGGAQRPQAEN
jgi:hypothetical protein